MISIHQTWNTIKSWFVFLNQTTLAFQTDIQHKAVNPRCWKVEVITMLFIGFKPVQPQLNIHPFWAGEHMNSRKGATIDIHCGRCGHKVQVGIVGSHKLLGKQRTFGVLFEGGWKISALNFTSHGWKGWFTRSKGEMPAAQHVWELKLILTCDTLVWEKKLWWWCACISVSERPTGPTTKVAGIWNIPRHLFAVQIGLKYFMDSSQIYSFWLAGMGHNAHDW